MKLTDKIKSTEDILCSGFLQLKVMLIWDLMLSLNWNEEQHLPYMLANMTVKAIKYVFIFLLTCCICLSSIWGSMTWFFWGLMLSSHWKTEKVFVSEFYVHKYKTAVRAVCLVLFCALSLFVCGAPPDVAFPPLQHWGCICLHSEGSLELTICFLLIRKSFCVLHRMLLFVFLLIVNK